MICLLKPRTRSIGFGYSTTRKPDGSEVQAPDGPVITGTPKKIMAAVRERRDTNMGTPYSACLYVYGHKVILDGRTELELRQIDNLMRHALAGIGMGFGVEIEEMASQ